MQDDKQGKCMIYGSQDAIDRAIVMQQHQDAQGLAADVCDAARQQKAVRTPVKSKQRAAAPTTSPAGLCACCGRQMKNKGEL